MEHFVAGTTARTAARLVEVHRNTAALYFHRLREVIMQQLEAESSPLFDGEVEVNESYFGVVRKGRRGRGAGGKVPVFGRLKLGGRVYTRVIADASGGTLAPLVTRKVAPESMVYSERWRGYNALDVSDLRPLRINHSERFARGRNHINGIENVWNQAKRHLRRFNGVPRAHFELFLKECEWRFNPSDPKVQLSQIKQWVKMNAK